METPIYIKVNRKFKDDISMYAMKNKLLGNSPSSITRLLVQAAEEYIERHPIP
jgi:hypothetical protein